MNRKDTSDILCSSLICLGLNPSLLELNDKIASNEILLKTVMQKNGDQILYFLFVLINPQIASKMFKNSWPIYDKKVESQFRTKCFDLLKQLNQNKLYNLKPGLIVSKAAVDPSSKKIITSLKMLIRIALHTSITNTNSICLVNLPVLARKQKERAVAMKLIQNQKIFYYRKYTSGVCARLKDLQQLQKVSQKLLTNYRSLLTQRQEMVSSVLKFTQNSVHINENTKEKYSASNEGFGLLFREDFEGRVKAKNEEIEILWAGVTRLRSTDEKLWPLIQSIISRGSEITSFNGDCYMAKLKLVTDESIIKETKSLPLYSDEKLDLLSLFKRARDSLLFLLSHSQQQNEVEKDRTDGIVEQDSCRIKSLQMSLKVLSTKVADFRRRTALSIEKTDKKLNEYSKIFEDTDRTSEILSFYPPSPPMNLRHDSSKSDKVDTPFRLMQLTPGSNHCMEVLEKMDITPKSRKVCKSQKRDCQSSPTLLDDASSQPQLSNGRSTEDDSSISEKQSTPGIAKSRSKLHFSHSLTEASVDQITDNRPKDTRNTSKVASFLEELHHSEDCLNKEKQRPKISGSDDSFLGSCNSQYQKSIYLYNNDRTMTENMKETGALESNLWERKERYPSLEKGLKVAAGSFIPSKNLLYSASGQRVNKCNRNKTESAETKEEVLKSLMDSEKTIKSALRKIYPSFARGSQIADCFSIKSTLSYSSAQRENEDLAWCLCDTNTNKTESAETKEEVLKSLMDWVKNPDISSAYIKNLSYSASAQKENEEFDQPVKKAQDEVHACNTNETDFTGVSSNHSSAMRSTSYSDADFPDNILDESDSCLMAQSPNGSGK